MGSWVGSVLLWGAQGSGTGWLVLRGARVVPLAEGSVTQLCGTASGTLRVGRLPSGVTRPHPVGFAGLVGFPSQHVCHPS